MKNFKAVSDADLLTQIKLDAANERRAGLAVIHQLREISRRRLHAELGYSSLFMYCVEELNYSKGSAYRRIKAMEALGDLPDLEPKLQSGELSLAAVSQVESFCQAHQKTPDQKKAIFEQVACKSKRETEALLAELAPEPVRPDSVKPKGKGQTELRITLDQATLEQLEKIRDLIAHSHPGACYSEVIQYLAKLGLKKLDPTLKKGRKPKVRFAGEPAPVSSDQLAVAPSSAAVASKPSVPAATVREVWKRDGSKCGYVAPNGRACGATAFLQIDHAVPRAKGGSNDLSNLRLRCQSHNILTAVQEFGAEKMAAFSKAPGN